MLRVSDLSEEQKKKFRLLDNKTSEFAGWDFEKLDKELDGLDFGDFDFGFDEFLQEPNDDILPDDKAGNMKEKFLVAPFSILRGDSGEWLERKKMWINSGLKSELGRG